MTIAEISKQSKCRAVLSGRALGRWLRLPLAAMLAGALAAPKPAPAQVTLSCAGLSGSALLNCLTLSQSGSNSGGSSSSGPTISTGKVVGIIAGVGAATAVLVYLVARKNRNVQKPALQLLAPPARFADIVPGRTETRSARITNLMNEAITVRAVSAVAKSRAVAVADAFRTPLVLAPGEKYDIPLVITSRHSGGRARLRLLASKPGLKKDAVIYLDVSYGRGKPALAKLIP